MGGSLENFILARNFQSRSKSRIFLIFGPSGSFLSLPFLGGRFGYFLFFFFSGRGKAESEAPGGRGIHFLLKIPGRGGGFQEGPRGREGVCGELGNWGGGGA